MIERMTKYSFILLNREKEGFLDELSELGVMDITRSTKPIDERSAEMLGAAEALNRRIALLEKGDWQRDDAYADLLARKDEAERALASRQPWGEADGEKIAALERRGIVFHYYVIPEKKFDPAWKVERSGWSSPLPMAPGLRFLSRKPPAPTCPCRRRRSASSA